MRASPRTIVQSVKADEASKMSEEYVSVKADEALMLVTPFEGNKREVLAFISNVDTAFDVINPIHSDRLYKFVFTRISGEPTTASTQTFGKLGGIATFLTEYLHRKTHVRLSCKPII
jgi:hypothetical protein